MPSDRIAAARQPSTRRVLATKTKTDRILDAAVDVFSRNGLAGGRLEEIADLADVSKTNLLYHFRTKEELYTAALERMLDIWLVPLREFDPARDPIMVLTDYITQKMIYSRVHPAASRLFCMEMLQGAPLLKDRLQGALREIVDAKSAVIEGWIAAGSLRPVTPRHLIFSIWAVTQHYADFAAQIAALTDKTLDDDAFFAESLANVVNLFLSGLRP